MNHSGQWIRSRAGGIDRTGRGAFGRLVNPQTQQAPRDSAHHQGGAPAETVVLRIGAGRAGRQRGNRRDSARLYVHFAPVSVNDGCGAAGGNHHRIADIGVDPAVDRLEALALIDRQTTLSRLNRSSPRGGAQEHRKTNRAYEGSTFGHWLFPESTTTFITPELLPRKLNFLISKGCRFYATSIVKLLLT